MGVVVDLPETNVRAWQVFAERIRTDGDGLPVTALDYALQEVRPLFLEVWRFSNFESVCRDGEDMVKHVEARITEIVLPLLVEIVRCKLELHELRERP